MQLFEHINQRGTTIVIATHDQNIVDMMRKRVIHLEHGVVVRDEEGGYSDENQNH